MATYNSAAITRDPAGGRGPGTQSATTNTTIGLASGITLTNNDILPICYIPFGCYIKSFVANFPIVNPSGSTLTISVVDSLASPTTYISSSNSGSNFSAATTLTLGNFTAATMGTMYGQTSRSQSGTTGSAVVVWAANVQLRLKVTATATAAVSGAQIISCLVEFAPAYDMGV